MKATKSKGGLFAYGQVPPAGKIRQSQVVSTFGPGAMVDLVDNAVLVRGLDWWKYDARSLGEARVDEPRLAERLRAMGVRLRGEAPFLKPPAGDDHKPTPANGIEAFEFPWWFVCQNAACRALVRKDGLTLVSGRYVHDCERGKKSVSVPVRFVAACRRGHLDDFPWIPFAHDGRSCASPALKLTEGATGDFSEVLVRCACERQRRLSDATVERANPPCQGRRPWLGREADQECEERIRLLVRTASNSYFTLCESALSIPPRKDDVRSAVQAHWTILQAADATRLPAFRAIPEIRQALAAHADEDVLRAVEAVRRGVAAPIEPLRTAEWKQIVSASRDSAGELPKPDTNFFAREVEPEGGRPDAVRRLVLLHKLREVRVQIGFTRIAAETPNLQGEFEAGAEPQDLGLQTDWLPASEIRGEGIFLQLEEERVRAWEARPAVQDRGRALLAGFDSWARMLRRRPDFPGVRFYLLHSLSHLLVSAVSLECGYAASAIRERIYCAPASDATPMAGILLSTGSPGTEGTLGGLVEQGRSLRYHLDNAREFGSLCSNDPVCAMHEPEGDPAERFLEGAACHGCLFIAESSCEWFNRYLDRALVVPTIGRPRELAFFAEAS